MKSIKGFVTINQFVNNIPGNISALGELSTWSSTYSKERGDYVDNAVPGYGLTTFKSTDTVSGTSLPVVTSQVSQIIQLVRRCVVYASVHIRPYNLEDFRNTILSYLDFSTRIANVNFGVFVDNGSIALPQWISWNSTEHDNTFVKIWLSDQAFADQYDEYEIQVIPPLGLVDDFFRLYNLVTTDLEARTLNDLSNIIQTIKNRNPETYLRIMNFDFLNLNSSTQRHPTNWAVIVYGRAGDNIDAIKDAIVEYILSHSLHTRTEWENILPDLFKRTEFVILPRWDLVSIPNLTELSALYSSIVDPTECITFARTNVSFYQPTYVNTNTRIMSYDYKALTLLIVNGQTNIVEKQDIMDMFPDYIPVSSASIDFNRMQVKTREWVLFLEELLISAETATEFTSVSNQLRRVKRGNNIYITALYDNVNYLVAARSNTFYQ